MKVRRRSAESALSWFVLATALVAAVTATYSARQYYVTWRLAEAGARYAAVHGATSHPEYMRPEGTTTALRDYLARRTDDKRLDVSVSPADPNTLVPGTFVTVTVARPLVPALSTGFVLRSSSSAAVRN